MSMWRWLLFSWVPLNARSIQCEGETQTNTSNLLSQAFRNLNSWKIPQLIADFYPKLLYNHLCVCVGWKWFILARKCIEFGYSRHIHRLQTYSRNSTTDLLDDVMKSYGLENVRVLVGWDPKYSSITFEDHWVCVISNEMVTLTFFAKNNWVIYRQWVTSMDHWEAPSSTILFG